MEEQKPQEEKTITFKKSTVWMIFTFVFLGLFIISLFTGGFGIKDNNQGPTGAAIVPTGGSPTQEPSLGKVEVKEIMEDDPVLGEKDAPITLIEFSDFQCPFCQRFVTQTLGQIKTNYIDTGKVKMVYRDFPLESIHPQARPAAEAGECADEQGKFWEYHDKLFENQQIWASSGKEELKKYAEELGLDSDKFNDCLDSSKYKDEVTKDLADAQKYGGRGTPFFVLVNEDGETQVISGAVPFANFEAAIKALL